ncbi:hypothetical protein WICMUC_004260 [Wickerhamomyces mucosus]|uniref:MICOS complex subunit n=1 Tax=Wickerhamomyces mucosus TaxID=1378264 RepID=A0A9P8TB93_9ASCO|nr:hypothetical protein WICMUC_004260 [Wickerhamomyces mucosus]
MTDKEIKTPSRSFYSNEEDPSISQIISNNDNIKSQIIQNQKDEEKPVAKSNSKEIISKYVDGYQINSNNYLETQLNSYRSSIISKLNYIDAEYKNLKSASKNEFKSLTDNITSVYDPKDQFLPNFIYALTTTLSGSILVSKKSLPIRFLTPILFSIGSFKFFLPNTFNNSIQSIKNWENEELPQLLKFQKSIKSSISQFEQSIEKSGENLNQSLIETVHDIRTSFISKEK